MVEPGVMNHFKEGLRPAPLVFCKSKGIFTSKDDGHSKVISLLIKESRPGFYIHRYKIAFSAPSFRLSYINSFILNYGKNPFYEDFKWYGNNDRKLHLGYIHLKLFGSKNTTYPI